MSEPRIRNSLAREEARSVRTRRYSPDPAAGAKPSSGDCSTFFGTRDSAFHGEEEGKAVAGGRK
jgi:hypothetical protein